MAARLHGVLFVVYFVPVQLLRLSQPSAKVHSDEAVCTDQSTEKIHPVVASLSQFFQLQQVQVIPFALTALSGLRFGGIAMSIRGDQHVFDDDLDFIVMTRDLAHMTKLVDQFVDYLHNKTSLDSIICYIPGDIVSWQPGENSFRSHFAVYVDLISEVTDVPNALPERLIQKQYNKETMTISKAISRVQNQQIHKQKIFKSCSVPLIPTDHFTMVDLWFDPEGKLLAMESLNSKLQKQKILIAGVPFTFPVTEDNFANHMHAVLCRPWGRMSEDVDFAPWCKEESPKFCSLSLPGYGGYDGEIVESAGNANKVFIDCARKLHAKGFKSFSSCHQS